MNSEMQPWPRRNWWQRNWKWFVPTGCALIPSRRQEKMALSTPFAHKSAWEWIYDRLEVAGGTVRAGADQAAGRRAGETRRPSEDGLFWLGRSATGVSSCTLLKGGRSMKIKVTEEGLTIPKRLLEGTQEVEIRQEGSRLIVSPLQEDDPNLGSRLQPCNLRWHT